MLDDDLMHSILYNNEKYYTPTSKWLCSILYECFKLHIPNKFEFDNTFDVFEYLLSLNYSYLVKSEIHRNWSPYGQFLWRQRRLRNQNTLFKEFYESADKEKENWLPIKQGMFGGSYNTYSETKKKLVEFLSEIHIG
jgi:hypothetical protein